MAELERPDFLEKHYTVPELAKVWRMSPASVRAWFAEEPGVIKYGSPKLKQGRQRTHVSLRVPESVARRVYRRRTGRDILPGRDHPAKG